MRLKVADLKTGNEIKSRTKIIQKKTGRPVQFEITKQTRQSIQAWMDDKSMSTYDWLFPSRKDSTKPLTPRQYGRIVAKWVA